MLHFIGNAYGTRPSQLVGIYDPYMALNFDAAVLSIGREQEREAYEDTKTEKAGAVSGSKSDLGNYLDAHAPK